VSTHWTRVLKIVWSPSMLTFKTQLTSCNLRESKPHIAQCSEQPIVCLVTWQNIKTLIFDKTIHLHLFADFDLQNYILVWFSCIQFDCFILAGLMCQPNPIAQRIGRALTQ